MTDVENVIIVGSGPAGYTAALYTARANLDPLVIEGVAWGGLLQQTTRVAKHHGVPPRRDGAGDDAALPLPGRALRRAPRDRRRHPDRDLTRGWPAQGVGRGPGTPDPRPDPGHGCPAPQARGPRRARALGPGRQLLRDLRCRLLPRRTHADRRRWRLGDGGGHVPVQVRLHRRDRASP